MDEKMQTAVELKIAHVLFLDIVGYSKLLIDEQSNLLVILNETVRQTTAFRAAEERGRLVKLPTGDGMALVFFDSPEAPVECALEIGRALKDVPALRLRMGVHSGPVSGVVDVGGKSNVAGAGINIAQRVMDCGDAGHLLISKRVAEDLGHFARWRPYLHDLGECEVKHGTRVHIFNVYADDVGNAAVPQKLRRRGRYRRKWFPLIAAILIATPLVVWLGHSKVARRNKDPIATNEISDKSIAVLPFENLSSDPNNAYFAVGIQDEVLTHLAKLGALKVISRTSTQQYASRGGNLRDIAKQLGVANILEGSVQRMGDQVHVNVQLIRAATDEHLWANTYDRKLDNIFTVEGEVAAAVAEALQATLSGSEQRSLTEKVTSNAAAYDAYLRGLSFSVHDDMAGNNLAAIKAYEEAVRLDPAFGLAWARLAWASAYAFYGQHGEDFARYHDTARKAANHARALQPSAPETVLADGYVEYYCDLNYDAAIRAFERAGQLAPNNSQALRALALCYRRKLQWDRSLEYFARAVQLDPRDTTLLGDQEDTLQLMHQLPAALAVANKILEITPDDVQMLATKAEVLHQMGDLSAAGALLAPLHPETYTYLLYKQAEQFVFERKFGDAIARFKLHISEKIPGAPPNYEAQIRARIAQLTDWMGEHAAAQKLYEQVRAELDPLYTSETEDGPLVQGLATALAALGEKEKAYSLVKRLIETQMSKNPIDAMQPQVDLARLYAQCGDKDAAIRELTVLLGLPSLLNPGELRIDPVWDPIRNEPTFQKLCQPNKN